MENLLETPPRFEELDPAAAAALVWFVSPQGLDQRKDFLNLLLEWRATTGRNEPCPCGSGLKFKRCHQEPDYLRDL